MALYSSFRYFIRACSFRMMSGGNVYGLLLARMRCHRQNHGTSLCHNAHGGSLGPSGLEPLESVALSVDLPMACVSPQPAISSERTAARSIYSTTAEAA
jgi:hypothetical protein